MDTAQWPQEIVVKPIEDIVVTNTCPKPPPASAAAAALDQRKPRPQKEQALNCPRCHSINTKFCYYNNYSLTQPRYFCKTCRRYWTEGGSLRNIPVGGGSRKNKRSSSSVSYNSSSPSANSTKSNNNKLPDLVVTPPSLSQSTCTTQNPKIIKIHEGQDLNLGFPTPDFRNISELVIQQNNNSSMSASASSCSSSASTTTTVTASTSHLSALELLTGMTPSSTGGLQYSFMPVPADPNSTHVYSTCGFPLHDFKPALNFSLDHGIGGGSGYASLHQGVNHQETTSGRLLFPFEDLKQVPSNGTNPAMDQNNNKEQHGNSTTGYWTGMLGGGSWFWGVSCRNIHLCLKAGLTLTMKQVIITSY